MEAPAVGGVVLVRFPFSDLTSTKLRPPAVIADAGREDYALCQITSNPYADPLAIELLTKHFEQGGLQRTSYLRPGKLFTGSVNLMERTVGMLTPATHAATVRAIEALLRSGVRANG